MENISGLERRISIQTLFLHVALGLAAAAMEFVTAVSLQPHVPFYMDTAWNTAVSFASLAGGITASVCFQLLCAFFGWSQWSSIVFTICSLSVTICVRIFVKKAPEATEKMRYVLSIILLILAETVIISVEGGILYILIFKATRFGELASTNSFIFSLILQDFPYTFAAIVGRLPVNLVDKTICTVSGIAIHKIAMLIVSRMKKRFCA